MKRTILVSLVFSILFAGCISYYSIETDELTEQLKAQSKIEATNSFQVYTQTAIIPIITKYSANQIVRILCRDSDGNLVYVYPNQNTELEFTSKSTHDIVTMYFDTVFLEGTKITGLRSRIITSMTREIEISDIEKIEIYTEMSETERLPGNITVADPSFQKLIRKSKYEKWIQFWKSKIPEVNTASLEKSDIVRTIYWSKIDLDDWYKKIEMRKYTLNYSEWNNYVVDVYNEDVFKYKNDNIFVEGGDIDPSFVILNLKDSSLYYLTLGPYSFFDESIWLSESICYVLGFSFDDSGQDVSKAYSCITILKIDLNTKSIYTV
jgi:hypothetical protein